MLHGRKCNGKLRTVIILYLLFAGSIFCFGNNNYIEIADDVTVDTPENVAFSPKHLICIAVTGVILMVSATIFFLGRMKKLNLSKKALEQINQELVIALTEVKKLSRHDPLTNLPNRRAMLEKIDSEMIRYMRSSRTFVFIMIDIDDFKAVNDRYGHETGDFLLKELASIFTDHTRAQDMVCRWGGEEFLILLPETDCDGGHRVAEKIRITVESRIFRSDNCDFNVTISSGVTDYSPLYDLHEHVKVVDDAMYESKRSGKNRITTVSMIRKKS